MFFNGQSLIKTTCLNCRFLFLLKLIMRPLPMLHTHLKNSEHISYQVCLHLFIDRSIMVEGGQMIYFKQPRLQLPVQHDVKAQ